MQYEDPVYCRIPGLSGAAVQTAVCPSLKEALLYRRNRTSRKKRTHAKPTATICPCIDGQWLFFV